MVTADIITYAIKCTCQYDRKACPCVVSTPPWYVSKFLTQINSGCRPHKTTLHVRETDIQAQLPWSLYLTTNANRSRDPGQNTHQWLTHSNASPVHLIERSEQRTGHMSRSHLNNFLLISYSTSAVVMVARGFLSFPPRKTFFVTSCLLYCTPYNFLKRI